MASDSEVSLDVAPASLWDIETEIARAWAIIAATKAQAAPRGVPDDPGIFISATLADVLQTRPSSRHCVLGRNQHLSSRNQGVVIHGYTRCKGAKCPHCVGGWIARLLRRALGAWQGEPVYRATFTSDNEWRNSARARAIKSEYKGSYLRVRIGVEGESWVFAPGPVGEPVDSPGLGLADALLRSPAAGKRRYSTSIPAPSKEPTDFHAFNLPQGYTLEDATELAVQALGRPVQIMNAPRPGSHSKAYTIEGLAPEEVDRVQQALLPLEQMAAAEFERMTRGDPMVQLWIKMRAGTAGDARR